MSEPKLRQPIVVVLGHVDHGKCLHPDEEIYLADGRVVSIKSLYRPRRVELLEGGYERTDCNVHVYTVNRFNTISSKTTHSWRVWFEGCLYRVVLEDGSSVRVTPEHPFLTLDGWKRADELALGDLVAAPGRISVAYPGTADVEVPARVALQTLKFRGCHSRGSSPDPEALLHPERMRALWFAPTHVLVEVLREYLSLRGRVRSGRIIVYDRLERLKRIKQLMLKINTYSELSPAANKLTIYPSPQLASALDIEDPEYPEHILRLGDLVLLKVVKIEKVPYRGYVYDLTVPPTNCFVANGIIVHNTTLLDKIRGTAVARKEPGEITQHVGASVIPLHVIEKVTEPLKKMFPIKLRIPGLLFIDTPGHELFSNLRRRGGSVADFAILVVDVVEGFQQQTYESIEILRQRKVPFLVAANKIDRIPGWKPNPDQPFLATIKSQQEHVKWRLEEQVYKLAGELSRLGFNADRFDRIKDFTRTVAIVPVSAKTGEGIPELLAVLSGLTQQYMAKRLRYAEGPGKGVILEVKEEPGLGTTIDIILYDGIIRRGDLIVVGGLEEAFATKVRALLMPRPLEEIRAPESKFVQVEEVTAAAGVKVSAPNLERAIAGAPVYVVWDPDRLEELKKRAMEEVMSVRVQKDQDGVIVKADTLGTLEALVEALKRENIPVRLADVGPISKRDIVEASVSLEKNKVYAVILAFNVKPLPGVEEEARSMGIRIFRHNVIYKLLEDYIEWTRRVKEAEKRAELESLIRPGKIRILPGYVFRRSEPIIVGVEVLGGTIRPGYPLMTVEGKRIGEIQQIQDKGTPLKEAKAGAAVAVSIRGRAMVGRHVDEGDVLYTDIPEAHVKIWLTKYKGELSDDEKMVLKEYIELRRKQNPFYALT